MNEHCKKTTRFTTGCVLAAGMVCCMSPGLTIAGGLTPTLSGTPYTYQGELRQDGQPVEDRTCWFLFDLYDDPDAGNQINTVSEPIVAFVEDGRFTVETQPFVSDATADQIVWLEVKVCCAPDNCIAEGSTFDTLTPRQRITPAPLAAALPGLRTYSNGNPDAFGAVTVQGGAAANQVGCRDGGTVGGGGSTAEPNMVHESYGTIGGGLGNSTGLPAVCLGSTTAHAATISGGQGNSARGSFTTIGGGKGNTAHQTGSTVGGGQDNQSLSASCTVGGGEANTSGDADGVDTEGFGATVAGGFGNTAGALGAAIGGGGFNSAQAQFATIAGGGPRDLGNPDTNNAVYDQYGTIGGGAGNRAGTDDGDPWDDEFATISGGELNTASGYGSTVGGGSENVVLSSNSTIGGGDSNFVNESAGDATIAGGQDNEIIDGDRCAIGGGAHNRAFDDYCTVAGGEGNVAGIDDGDDNDQEYATVGGGHLNMATGEYSTIGGGGPIDEDDPASYNRASDEYATIGGGGGNQAQQNYSTVSGGQGNIAGGVGSTVGGGLGNSSAASWSTVPGGRYCVAGGRYSFAAGNRAKVRTGEESGTTYGDEGTFVWSDKTTASPDFFTSTGPNQFLIKATGGVGIGTPSPGAPLHVEEGSPGAVNAHSNSSLALARDASNYLNLLAPDANATGILFGNPGGGNTAGGILFNAGSTTNGLQLRTGGNSTRMIIEDDGDVGIGTTSPDARVHIRASDRTAKFDRLGSDGQLVAWARDNTVIGDVTVAGGVVSYNAFSGSHYARCDEVPEPGTLMVLTGRNQRLHADGKGEIVYGTAPSTLANDPACLGSFLSVTPEYDLDGTDDVALVTAVGNGELLVLDTGTDIRPGDLLISSDRRGLAMLDDPERFPVGHIVARAAEPVHWDSVEPSTDGSRQTKISVLFESFTRGPLHAAETIELQDKEIKALQSRLARMENVLLALAKQMEGASR